MEASQRFVFVGSWKPLLASIGLVSDLKPTQVIDVLRLMLPERVMAFQLGLRGALGDEGLFGTGIVDKPTTQGIKKLWKMAGRPEA